MIYDGSKRLHSDEPEPAGSAIAINAEAVQEATRQLRGESGRHVLTALLAHALNLARNYTWRGLRGIGSEEGELAKGKSCLDVVQDVIVDTLRGTRGWDPQKGELLPWLKDQVRSEMSHLVESREHKYERHSLDGKSSPASDQIEYRPISHGAIPVEPEAALLAAEEEKAIHQRIDTLLEVVSDEPELRRSRHGNHRWLRSETALPGEGAAHQQQ